MPLPPVTRHLLIIFSLVIAATPRYHARGHFARERREESAAFARNVVNDPTGYRRMPLAISSCNENTYQYATVGLFVSPAKPV